ncbi:MAG: riboflavin synthase [Halobacteriovoraceae bacterium]|nr:riboflavin synthase [Halobacteriovoraceae bacterium]|tara:strand:+ start:1055 stop:1681 length:627 start_codon:yes stop_codon:yes gene_type:complete
MFTGIIKDVGKVVSFEKSNRDIYSLEIETKLTPSVDDSVAVNGVCQTVISNNKNLKFNCVHSTMSKTNFSQLKVGQFVNLEQALRLDQGLDGHLVTGHVNSCAKVSKIINLGDSWLLDIQLPKLYMKYICPEGSVAINGVSLTVNDVKDLSFNVYIIPHTWKNTNLCFLKNGDLVNLEFDILAKYLERLLFEEKRFDKYKASLSEFLK